MPGRDPGPAPVARSVAVQPDGDVSPAARNYLTIANTLKAGKGEHVRALRAMLGSEENMKRFLAVVFSSLQGNGDLLANADPMSVVQAVLDAGSLGLEPTGLGGEGAIVRYGRSAKFLPMWRGYLKRIRNSGKVLDVDCQLVYMNDEFRIALGTNPEIYHVPALYGERDDETGEYLAERGGYRGVYAWALMPSGLRIIEYLSVDDVNAVRDRYAESWKNPDKRATSPWTTSWGEQARKTAIRRLSKRLPSEAVDKLLLLDAQADEAAGNLKVATEQASAAVSEVRRLALAAVGQAPQEPSGTAESSESGATDTAGPVGTTVEQADVAACMAESPYGDGESCGKARGHAGNHQSGGGTWS